MQNNKRKVFLLPIEPLESRYSAQWARWIPTAFSAAGYDGGVINGCPLTDHIETGTFLDINSTLHYKATQLAGIAKMFYKKMINPGDIFFVSDLEFWGIESIRYLSVLNKIPVKIYGFLHAASYTKGDFMEPCAEFAQIFERGWINICDKVFVGSNYHKRKIIRCRAKDEAEAVEWHRNKIVVSGNPWDGLDAWDGLDGDGYTKVKQVIFPNRPDLEKCPVDSLQVAIELKAIRPDVNMVFCTARKQWGDDELRAYAQELVDLGIIELHEGISKKEYYNLLVLSMVMVSNTAEENFGYCVIEACNFGCQPVVPDAFSHPELLGNNKQLLYKRYSLTDCVNLVEDRLDNPIAVAHYASRCIEALPNIIEAIKKDCGE